MSDRHERTISVIGERALGMLRDASVLVVGLGGVGGAACEVLVRSGVGALTLVDGDVFEPSNLNRQLLCDERSLGRNKAEAAAERMRSIDSGVKVRAVPEFLGETNVSAILAAGYTYCIDAIDDMKAKLMLVLGCKAAGIPVISALGAGNLLHCDFDVTQFFNTKNDPFARAFRRELRGKADALETVCACSPPTVRSGTPGSMAAPPLVMGAMLAGAVIRHIIGQ